MAIRADLRKRPKAFHVQSIPNKATVRRSDVGRGITGDRITLLPTLLATMSCLDRQAGTRKIPIVHEKLETADTCVDRSVSPQTTKATKARVRAFRTTEYARHE